MEGWLDSGRSMNWPSRSTTVPISICGLSATLTQLSKEDPLLASIPGPRSRIVAAGWPGGQTAHKHKHKHKHKQPTQVPVNHRQPPPRPRPKRQPTTNQVHHRSYQRLLVACHLTNPSSGSAITGQYDGSIYRVNQYLVLGLSNLFIQPITLLCVVSKSTQKKRVKPYF